MRTWAGAEHLKLHRCSLKMGKVHFYLSDHRLFRTSPLASGLQGEIMREENANEGPPQRGEQSGAGGSASGRPVGKRGGRRPSAWIYRAADLNRTWRLLPEMSILPRSRCGHYKPPMGPAGAGPGRTNATDDIKKNSFLFQDLRD